MRHLILSAALFAASAAWAGEFGTSENTDFSARAKTSKGSCDPQRLGAAAKAGAPGTVSHHKCKSAVMAALRKAGCNVSIGGPGSYNQLKSAGWNCSRSSPKSAPDGAIMMYQRPTSRHYEIKYKGCYYSDFHHSECLPATQYHHGRFGLIGWCAP